MIKHVATLEIPVKNLKKSIEWYTTHLELKCTFIGEMNAMLSFENSSPTIYLVQTNTVNSLSFINSSTSVEHSVIDFYTEDLEKCYNDLKSKGVEVGRLNMKGSFGGFGFKDPDGNHLSVTNALHKGQEVFKENITNI